MAVLRRPTEPTVSQNISSFYIFILIFRVLAVPTRPGAPAARPALLPGSDLLGERGQRVVRQVPGPGPQTETAHGGSLPRHLQSSRWEPGGQILNNMY